MKKFTAFLLALCMLAVPAAAKEVSEDVGLRMAAVCGNDNIEAGDQFVVKIVLDGDFEKYLTYSICGSFDSEAAELVAPIYKDDGFSIVYNEFSNETGTFQFDAADIAKIEGCDDPHICSLLFKAKKAGSFTVKLGNAAGEGNKLFLGRAMTEGSKYDYDFTVTGFEAEIKPDSDGKDVVVIAEEEQLTPYDDMEGFEWAEIAVGALARQGIFDGVAGESFEPAKSVTRGEFTAMLVRSAKIDEQGDEAFADVPEDYAFAAELKTAKKVGIALGDETGSFNPDKTVTRQDVCAFVQRALKYKKKLKSYASSVLEVFPDSGEISEYAVPSVRDVVGARLLQGDDKGKFRPLDEMTRAEAAKLLENVIIHIKLTR